MMQVLLKMSDDKSQNGGKSEARFKTHHLKNSLNNSSFKNLHKMFGGESLNGNGMEIQGNCKK